MNDKERETMIAQAIFDWLNRSEGEDVAGNKAQPPYTFNAGVYGPLWIGVDGDLDCAAMAAAVERKLMTVYGTLAPNPSKRVKGVRS